MDRVRLDGRLSRLAALAGETILVEPERTLTDKLRTATRRAREAVAFILTYSLEGGDAGKFRVDSSTGAIRIGPGQTFDYESAYWPFACGPHDNPIRPCYDLRVRVADG